MISPEEIEQAIIWACKTEVSAPKPGNVNCYSGAKNMATQDFIKSAHAIAPVLAQSNKTVGALILESIQATRTVVDCNTNLGIVLLFAPLCLAIQQCKSFADLPSVLNSVLENLSIDDAVKTYEAIRLAEAGGMGENNEQDINSTPTVTLREAMLLAKDRDTIAAQYSNNYHQILELSLEYLTSSIKCGETVEWASAFAYLYLLRKLPDSLIVRKNGIQCAQEIMAEADSLFSKTLINKKLSQLENDIITWDNELKRKALNPGTTADMTAATLLVYAFQKKLS